MSDRKRPEPSRRTSASSRSRHNGRPGTAIGGSARVVAIRPASTPAPLSPDSLTWQLFGDLRGLLLIVRTGTLQNMHPDISRALVEHSDFFRNPWHRLLRSIPPILGVVYDGDRSASTGRRVRDFHRGIGGRKADGQSYHALNPALFHWAHATFFESQIAMCEFFGTPLSLAEREQLYRESIQWYAQYGLDMSPVPVDYAGFQRYWQQMVDEQLRNTPVTTWYFHGGEALPAPYDWLRGPLWSRLLRPIVDRGSRWLAAGTLPPVLRERLGLAWSAEDEQRLRQLGRTVGSLWRLVPHDWRYLPVARRALRRAAA